MNDITKDIEEFHNILNGYENDDEWANKMKSLLRNIEIAYLKLKKQVLKNKDKTRIL